MEIRNIIFDLGGVLLNVDYHATIDSFKQLGVKNIDEFFTQAHQSRIFDGLDKGKTSPEEFRDELRKLTGLSLADNEIDRAWNAMLLDLPQQNLPLLEKVKDNYRIFLLSNTNAIHFPNFLKYLQEAHGYESLDLFFEKQYLSHEVGMRKPDVEIFEHVIHDNNLIPSETLFIDDTRQHVIGARKAGLQAYWLEIDKEVTLNLFEEGGKLNESFFKKLENQSL